MILRTCARAGAEYEWGVHLAAFADVVLSGFYRTVSYVVRALELPLEPWSARFAAG